MMFQVQFDVQQMHSRVSSVHSSHKVGVVGASDGTPSQVAATVLCQPAARTLLFEAQSSIDMSSLVLLLGRIAHSL